MTGSTDANLKPGYRAMLEEIARMARDTCAETGIANFSPQVMSALGKVPRHWFVQPGEECFACDNRPLYIGHGQTISQPYIVALMTELLHLDKNATVLEVGTGSGYQTAVLAELAGKVYSVEIIEPLARAAAGHLQELGCTNVELRTDDGYSGWPEHAPFDAIIVTAAAAYIPQPLLEQLRPGGRMVIPVGKPYQTQELMLVSKNLNGQTHTHSVLPVSFVPLTGGH